MTRAVARAVTVEVPSPLETESSTSWASRGAPTPFPETVIDPPDGLPPSPGGRSKRENGVMVIGEVVFVPMR